jgi:hypothetical protein
VSQFRAFHVVVPSITIRSVTIIVAWRSQVTRAADSAQTYRVDHVEQLHEHDVAPLTHERETFIVVKSDFHVLELKLRVDVRETSPDLNVVQTEFAEILIEAGIWLIHGLGRTVGPSLLQQNAFFAGSNLRLIPIPELQIAVQPGDEPVLRASLVELLAFCVTSKEDIGLLTMNGPDWI